MKPLNLKIFILFAITIAAFGLSCKKLAVQEVECGYSSERPPNILLSLTDSQDRDLLDPATTGYYDINKIIQNNEGVVARAIFDKPAGDAIRLMLVYYEGEKTSYLKISNTDTDTIYTKYEVVPHKCNPKFLLKSFKYNGKEMADSVKQRYFTIKK